MLTHSDIWRAIDRLAERHGLSPSGLARKAGLSATLFNPSKRVQGGRNRWPSTESIAAILKATNASLDSFVALASAEAQQHTRLPFLGWREAKQAGRFDEQGRPIAAKWDELSLPGANDGTAFVLEVSGQTLAPVFPDGTKLLFSPGEKLRRGDRIGVRTKQGEILIKQLGREGAQKIELLPLTLETNEPPLTLLRRDIDWICRISWASQ